MADSPDRKAYRNRSHPAGGSAAWYLRELAKKTDLQERKRFARTLPWSRMDDAMRRTAIALLGATT